MSCYMESQREMTWLSILENNYMVLFSLLMGGDLSKFSMNRDRRFIGSQKEFDHTLQTLTTVYVGNMSFSTTEEQVYELFSLCRGK